MVFHWATRWSLKDLTRRPAHYRPIIRSRRNQQPDHTSSHTLTFRGYTILMIWDLRRILTFGGTIATSWRKSRYPDYDLLISNKMLTHVTTKLNSQELEDLYGNRLRSRMRAMFNLIAFNIGSKDKKW
jgi:hypothetical protein